MYTKSNNWRMNSLAYLIKQPKFKMEVKKKNNNNNT